MNKKELIRELRASKRYGFCVTLLGAATIAAFILLSTSGGINNGINIDLGGLV